MFDLMDIEILQISYDKTLPIRQQVLWPDKGLEFCLVDGDQTAHHFAAVINSEIISIASIYIDGSEARLRKFATLKKWQRKGIGSQVIIFILKYLNDMEMVYLWCDARSTAIDFYKKFGLAIEGDSFYKSGIAYHKMSVNIEASYKGL
jgi:GNAT superfamily N-acetyltransferase